MNTIFIVDDHPVIRLAIRMLLEHEGYEIVGETDNGVDAMQMIRECVPDLIILDISIPKLDGLEVLARFNAMNSTISSRSLTNLNSSSSEELCPSRFSGVNAWLGK